MTKSMSKRSDAGKAIERLPRPERIRFAKAKMKKVIDHFLFVIELHANNSFVVFSPLLASQIPNSYAANAFNVFQRSMYQIEIVRLCAIWDGIDVHKENIPTVVKLIDDHEVIGMLVEETRSHRVNGADSGLIKKDDPISLCSSRK
jgi:AbiU2